MLYIDANILIYLLEQTEYSQQTADRIAAYLQTGDTLVTSTITVAELVAGAVQDAASTVNRMPMLQVLPVSSTVAERAGLLRREHRLKPLDALHLATALNAHAEQFFTNDRPLMKTAAHYLPIMEL